MAHLAQRDLRAFCGMSTLCEGAHFYMCRDAEGAGVAHLVRLHEGACGAWQPKRRPDILVTNPPWGNRLLALEYDAPPEQVSALEAAWTELGLFLKVCSRPSIKLR